MRELKDHIVEGDSVNHQLKIEVTDQPGSGGAHHRYHISGFDVQKNPLHAPDEPGTRILFQNGPIGEAGVNGLTQEALLVIVIDRLRGFQEGPFSSVSNENALRHCEIALHHLQERTRERLTRGVEGTHQK